MYTHYLFVSKLLFRNIQWLNLYLDSSRAAISFCSTDFSCPKIEVYYIRTTSCSSGGGSILAQSSSYRKFHGITLLVELYVTVKMYCWQLNQSLSSLYQSVSQSVSIPRKSKGFIDYGPLKKLLRHKHLSKYDWESFSVLPVEGLCGRKLLW